MNNMIFCRMDDKAMVEYKAWHLAQVGAWLERTKELPFYTVSKGCIKYLDYPLSKVHITKSKKVRA